MVAEWGQGSRQVTDMCVGMYSGTWNHVCTTCLHHMFAPISCKCKMASAVHMKTTGFHQMQHSPQATIKHTAAKCKKYIYVLLGLHCATTLPLALLLQPSIC